MSLTLTRKLGDTADLEMAVVEISANDLVGINSAGYAKRFALGDKFAGLANDSQDNGDGAVGDKKMNTFRGPLRIATTIAGAALTDAINRAPVYATDHETLSLREGQQVGRVEQYLVDGRCVVVLDPSVGGVQILSQTCALADFTDNGDATGFVDFTATIPEGSLIVGVQVEVQTVFDGGGQLVDVGVAGDLAIFANDLAGGVADVVGNVVAEAEQYRSADTTVRVTITEDSDFDDYTTGEIDVKILYETAGQVG